MMKVHIRECNSAKHMSEPSSERKRHIANKRLLVSIKGLEEKAIHVCTMIACVMFASYCLEVLQAKQSLNKADHRISQMVNIKYEPLEICTTGIASIMLKNFLEPDVLIAVHDHWEKFANPIKINASGATTAQIDHA